MSGITGNELALKCGVSRGTLDRALKGRLGISSKTRERILKAVEEHGYRPNFIGQALSTKKTMTIGIVIFDFRHSFFAELYAAFEHEADRFNYVAFPMLSYGDPQREIDCINRLVDRNVDGIIVLPVNKGRDYEEFLESLKMPVVCIGNRVSDNIPFSGIDDMQAACDATDYLLALEYEKILYYCPPMSKEGRVNLYAQTQRLAGFQTYQPTGRIDERPVMKYQELLKRLDKVAETDRLAILCSSDFYAMELQKKFRDASDKSLAQVKLMGFDGLDLLRFSHPPISTVRFSRKVWAQKSFGQIYSLMVGKTAADEMISHDICNGMCEDLG